MSGSRAKAGMTLLEVVLALGLLALGMSAILGLYSFGAGLSRNALLRSEAAAATDAVVAELEETLFPLGADGRAGEPLEITQKPVPGHPGIVYAAKAVPNPDALLLDGVPREYRVDVELTWSTRGQQRAQRMQLLMLREVSFGERMRRISASTDG